MDLESGAAACPAGYELEGFESGSDGYKGGGAHRQHPIQCPLRDYERARLADWPLGLWLQRQVSQRRYTSGGQKWAWLVTSQGTGIIDFTQETAGYVGVYTSPYSGVYL